jgi:hypothetical protein
MQQRNVFERTGHRNVVIEPIEGPLQNLDGRRPFKTLVRLFEFA